MNAERSDFDRALRSWFEDGPTVMSDRVVDGIADRIARQPQRLAWRLPWRFPKVFNLSFTARNVLVAAVLLVALGGGAYLIGGGGPGPVPTQSTTPVPTAQPSAPSTSAPSTSAPSPTPGSGMLPDGLVRADGHYTFPEILEFPGMTIAADIPAGWVGYPQFPALIGPGRPGVDGVLIGFMKADGIFSDPCHWDVDGSGSSLQPGDVDAGSTVADLVEALRAQTAYTSSAASPVTIGGFQGSVIELQLPGQAVLETCDTTTEEPTEPKYIVLGTGFWAQGADNVWRLYILDVAGSRLVVMVNFFAANRASEIAAADALVRSFVITPAS